MKYYIVDATELEALSLPVRGAWIEMYEVEANCKGDNTSLPVRGAWIEMILPVSCRFFPVSLPVRGAWIEITASAFSSAVTTGRSPCGERGLKSVWQLASAIVRSVAPRAGSVD